MQTELNPARALGLLGLLGLGIACFLVLKPFFSALLWAAILVYATWPAFRFLRDRMRLSAGGAATVMVMVEFLLIGLPLVFATPVKREDIDSLRGSFESFLTEGLPGLGTWLASLPLVGPYIGEYLQGVDLGLGEVASLLRPYAGTVAQNALSILLAVLSGLAEVLVAIFLAWFLYRDGPKVAEYAERSLSRLAGERTRHLVELTGNVTRGVVYGLLGTAIVQGLMTVFGLWVTGVPRPLLLGVVAGCLSILPIGAPLVWIPATLYLFATDKTWPAVFLGLYGALGISSADNVIRPWLISRGADLPLLLTLLGALGGVLAFGFLGLFLGPVLLAVGYTLLQDWAAGAGGAPAEEAVHPLPEPPKEP